MAACAVAELLTPQIAFALLKETPIEQLMHC